MIILLLGFVVAFVIFIIWAFRHRSPVDVSETIISFTGGLGSGKTADGVHYAKKCYKILCKLARKNKFPKPKLYSNIPIKVSRKHFCEVLTTEILTLQKSIPLYSVVFIDEIGSFCSQYQYKGSRVEKFDEFVRFFRHYVRGTIICTDQCSENIVLTVRRRMNYVFNLRKFRKWWLLPVCTVDCRLISLSEEIKSVVNKSDDDDFSDGYKRFFFFGNPFKYYDSYCYSVRYNNIPPADSKEFSHFKTDHLLKIDD